MTHTTSRDTVLEIRHSYDRARLFRLQLVLPPDDRPTRTRTPRRICACERRVHLVKGKLGARHVLSHGGAGRLLAVEGGFSVKPEVDREVEAALGTGLGEDDVVPRSRQVEAISAFEARVCVRTESSNGSVAQSAKHRSETGSAGWGGR